jgi:hypothetical protein
MGDRSEDIHIDISPMLMGLTISQVVQIANLAMNRLTMRDWGEIFYAVDVRAEMAFVSSRTSEPGKDGNNG